MKNSKKLWIVISILLIINIMYYIGQWGGSAVLQMVSDFYPIVCSLIAIICLIYTYKGFSSFDFTKIAWLMILIGIVLFFMAETTYAILEIAFKFDMNEYFPSLADYFWSIGYFPMFIGLAMMLSGYKKSGLPLGNSKLYLALFTLILVVSVMVFYFLIIPILTDTETNLLSKIIYLLYPIADLFLVIPAILLMYITSLFGGGTISKPWKYLTFGFIFITIADLLYSYLGWQDLYNNGNFIDIAWHAGYLFIGLAGVYQRQLVESLNKR